MSKNNNFIFTMIIIFFLLLNYNKGYIVLPFKINSPPKTSNLTELVYDLIDNQIIVTLPIGEPKTNIDFYSSMNLYLYYLEEGSCLPNSNSSYNITKSKSYSFVQSLHSCNLKLDNCILGKEKLYVYNDIFLKDITELSPFKFYFGNRIDNINKDDKRICGKIGFQIENAPYHYYQYDNFIKTLKKYAIINTYSWYIHYYEKPYKKNEQEIYDGAIIFDIFNQTFFDDLNHLKTEKDYNTINAKDFEAILAWTFSFDKIYYDINDTRIEINNKESGLALETNFVLSPEAYFESIKIKFFDYFFKNNICYLEKKRYHFIYCDKKKFTKNDIKNYPTIYFKSNGLNKVFILNGEDVFKEYNNYYIFMILFKEYSYKLWVLGQIFMKKYHFYFDSDKKLIGCFEEINEQKKNHKFISFFDKIKWYLFIIIGIIIGFLIGKKIRDKTRKLRANELEDNYEYLENRANDKNNNNNISNYKEIKSQLFEINH